MTRKARILLISLLVAAGISLSGCASNDDFNSWISSCSAEGGHVALMHKGSWADNYECFKNDEVIVVPGYEGQ